MRDGQYLLCDIDTVKAVPTSIRGTKVGTNNRICIRSADFILYQDAGYPKNAPLLNHPTQGYGLKESSSMAALTNRRIAKLYQAIVGQRYISATIAVALFRPKI